MGKLKAGLRKILPPSVTAMYRNSRLRLDMRKAEGKTRRDVFTDIYNNNRWGGENGTYSSGLGSQPEVAEIYAKEIRSLMLREKVRSIVDIGCGDFQVGQRLITPEISYIGCDIVPELIIRNRKCYGRDGVEFLNLDAVSAPLPQADLCLIRQVFQHLSNADIKLVLNKARQYSLVVVTDEQLVKDNSTLNMDIPPYHGTRRVFGQGLKLEREPFSEKIEVLFDAGAGEKSNFDTYLRTVLIRNS
jgi:SAM-dependent methyltransferase